MNKRLEELARVANKYAWDKAGNRLNYTCQDFRNWEMEKFAELIINDCVNKAEFVGKHNKHPIEPIHTAKAVVIGISKWFKITQES
jgi:hypothetical protein